MTFKVKDHYFNLAKKKNYLARSAFKLEEINNKYKVIGKADQVLDLGYFPGSWIQYVSGLEGFKGKITGVDIQAVNESLNRNPNINLFEKSIEDIHELSDIEVSKKFNVILSDMAPKTIGIKTVDQLRSLALVEFVFSKIDLFLMPGGNLVVKIFESQDAQNFFKTEQKRFEKMVFFRPKSTRKVSKEYFAIFKGFKG